MIARAALAFLLQAGIATPAPRARDIAVQLGVSISPDTVTVGQRFIVILRLRAPVGASIEFPTESDSAASASPTATQLLGRPAIQSIPDSTGTTMSAAYRLAAWDIGPQKLGLADIVVRIGGRTVFVPLSDRGVFVRSVLPEDSALRIPKPPRPQIEVTPFNWWPWLIALAALVLAGLLWRVWVWYRRRRNAPLDPFSAAEQEFERIESMRLPESGESERHAALMSDVMRRYLATRVPGIERSHTSSELLAAAARIHAAARGLGELLWRTDLIKFAGARVDADEAERLGAAARGVVKAVEDFLVAEAESADERRAA
jgi:hypothetical protein